jgi:hypothetical protein
MADVLEGPGTDEDPDWDSLYRTRGEDVVPYRPVFTGDVFFDVEVGGGRLNVAILQHPCAIRVDGVTLQPTLLVAEVGPSAVLKPSRWESHNYKQMPLPELVSADGPNHFAMFFAKCCTVAPAELKSGRRGACLSQRGVNFLLQRWVHHNSRAIIATHKYQEVSSPQYEEADMIEDWCTDRDDDGIGPDEATREVDSWLSEKISVTESRRDQLQDPQNRSALRRDLRDHLRALRTNAA